MDNYDMMDNIATAIDTMLDSQDYIVHLSEGEGNYYITARKGDNIIRCAITLLKVVEA